MKKIVTVTQQIGVTIDETKINKFFIEEFKRDFYNFNTVDDHIEHLVQLYARGLIDNHSFIEGYGEAKDMGIRFEAINQDEEIEN